jgi:GNAT superfamily N-acetyltransferase
MEVRLAGPGDVDPVVSILEEAAAWLRSRGIDQWPAVFRREFVADHVGRREVYLAWAGAEAAATLSLQAADPEMWGERPPDALYLHGFAVRRRHAGLGRELLHWAERAAATAGRRYLRLDCMAANPGLRAYYERAGYVHRGTRPWPSGRDSSLYEKAL